VLVSRRHGNWRSALLHSLSCIAARASADRGTRSPAEWPQPQLRTLRKNHGPRRTPASEDRLHRSCIAEPRPRSAHQRRRRLLCRQRMTILTPRRNKRDQLRARASSIEPKRRLPPQRAPAKAPFPRGPSVCVRRKMLCTRWTSSGRFCTRPAREPHAAFEPTLGQARQARCIGPPARP